jgi:ABC-type polysaccharide/polyol phosphate transport system ATPase subunit
MPVLRVESLTKRFTGDLRQSRRHAIADMRAELLRRSASPEPRAGEREAVSDLSFEVGAGEGLAVLGPNGAGKSTLLKVVHGVLKPDAGRVRIRGRADALIELGTAFEPILTGRENVLVQAAVAGMAPTEAAGALEQIVDFADLGDQIDDPVRTYSSGMIARLGFATAAHLRPDLLLVDEVLSVGDVNFQRKCVAHIRSFLNDGGALVLVTHNAYLAQTVCSRGLVLDRGRSVFLGTVVEAVADHLRRSAQFSAQTPDVRDESWRSNDVLAIESVRVLGLDGGHPKTGEAARVVLTFNSPRPTSVIWAFSFWTADHWVSVAGDIDLRERTIDGRGELSCVIPSFPLFAGAFTARAMLGDPQTKFPVATLGFDGGRPPATFTVESSADERSNLLGLGGQLLALDVVWD